MDPLLGPELFREIEILKRTLEIQARSGALGERAAPRRGSSAEFREHRAYAPGDDPRRLDWLAFARTGQPVTKLFRAEEDAVVRLLFDGSASLDFGSPPKHHVAQRLAAAVGALALWSGQRAELYVARERADSSVPLVRSSQGRRGRAATAALLREIGALVPEGRADLARAVGGMLGVSRRPGLLAVVSDFLDPGPVTEALTRARAAGHDVALLQVLDRRELEPELEGDLRLTDSETGEELDVTLDAAAVESYVLRMAGLAESLRLWARRMGATYVRVLTEEPLPSAMRRFLKRTVD